MGRSLAAFDQTGAAMPGCVVRPEQTEGPYFVDQQLARRDIRTEPTTGIVSAGDVLTLALTVSDVTAGQCKPLPGAIVDVWQCDAKGVYSGVNDPSFNTSGQKFLRGVQTTDPSGLVRFTTIVPGWYSGRTVHIHFKIRTQAAAGAYEFTSQWYFDDAWTERILTGPSYARAGKRDTFNSNDGIFQSGGRQLMLDPTRGAEGAAASFGIGLDLADAVAGRPDGGGGRGRGPGGPPPPGGRGGRGQPRGQ